MMTQVAVTGAAGNVGSVTVDSLEPHYDVTSITHRKHERFDSVVLSVEDRDALENAFEGQDVVIHLAADPSPDAAWESVLRTNIDGTRNVFEAAVNAGVRRVVFASSNHIHHMNNIEDPACPETMVANPRAVHPDEPSCPDSYYGVSKVTGEALGTYFAERHRLEVINLRIGWLLSQDELRNLQSKSAAQTRYARAMWLSPRDCQHGMRQMVKSDLKENPTTANLLSANRDRYLTITPTMRGLGYEPQDDSYTVLEG